MSCNFTNWRKVDLKKFEPMPPRYSMGAATNWAKNPHAGSEENLRGFTFFVEETYALCNEITQIEPWQTQVSWYFINYRIGRKNNWEKKKNRFSTFLDLHCSKCGRSRAIWKQVCYNFSISKNVLSILWLAWRNYQIQGQVILFGST